MVGDRVHHDAESQNVATHNEDGKQQLSNTEELTPKRSHQNLTSIRQVLNVRVALVELSNNVTGVCGEKTEADDQHDGRRKAEGGEGSGQRQDTQRNGFSDHDWVVLDIVRSRDALLCFATALTHSSLPINRKVRYQIFIVMGDAHELTTTP